MGKARGVNPSSSTGLYTYVALVGVIALLILLLCYFLYFCIRRVKELSHETFPEPVRSVRPPPAPPKPTSQVYPVQPGVRESASAMARLCQPAAHTNGAVVYPSPRPRSPSRHPATLPPPRIISQPQSPVAKLPNGNAVIVPAMADVK